MKLWLDGRLVEARRAGVPVEAAILGGTALAEAMQVKGGRVPELRAHYARLEDGCRALLMDPPGLSAFAAACRAVLKANRLRQAALRCRFFRGGRLIVHPLPLPRPPRRPLRLFTTAVRHYGPGSLLGRLKSGSMLPNWLARAEAQAWADDGLRLTPDGYVAEGAWSNLVLERRGALHTPPLHHGILEGVTRAALLARWRSRRRPLKLEPLTRHDLYSAERIWVCSSLRGALPVGEVDGRKIGRML